VKQYWEHRLATNFDTSGVGFQGIGTGYNYWLYKIRKSSFLRAVRFLKMVPSATRVLEIGPGTGFYTKILSQKKISSYVGVDITETSVQRLQSLYPAFGFFTASASDDLDHRFPGSTDPLVKFDLVIAMDVFFHIVDDTEYHRALSNVGKHLKPNGHFIFSETFAVEVQHRGHIKDRTSSVVIDSLERHGFDVIKTMPVFVLMNRPLGSTNKVLLSFSEMRIRLLAFLEGRGLGLFGFIIGMILFPLDVLLTRLVSRTPCTTLVIAKKR
jgi:SAM-dependent methyltransferase